MTIGEKIKSRRKELGITPEELAKSVGVSRSTMFRYERGEVQKIPLNILELLAYNLKADMSFFVNDNMRMTLEEIRLLNMQIAMLERFERAFGRLGAEINWYLTAVQSNDESISKLNIDNIKKVLLELPIEERYTFYERIVLAFEQQASIAHSERKYFMKKQEGAEDFITKYNDHPLLNKE